VTCTRCDATGFLNLHQVDEATLARFDATGDPQIIVDWMEANSNHDIAVCDCCGSGEPWSWHYMPGLHDLNNPEHPFPECY
jgi:hypothetical protein